VDNQVDLGDDLKRFMVERDLVLYGLLNLGGAELRA
jgi:hypothetical protein